MYIYIHTYICIYIYMYACIYEYMFNIHITCIHIYVY